jgi:hypothetical protein
LQFADSQTFWKKILPPSSGSDSKPPKKPVETGGKLSLAHAAGALDWSKVLFLCLADQETYILS